MAEVNAAATAGEAAKTRYHGLDALRAWAMSMGIVLHAAWIMIPGEAGAPKTDASASSVADYICLAIHTFRMQLFFVLAGLFACLLVRKRGVWNFALNRILRIGLPLLLSWLILCPIMIYQYNAAGIQSGAILSDSSALELTKHYFANLSADNVMLMHLWFIYYLAFVYAMVIAARGLVSLLDRRGVVRQMISDAFAKILVSRWNAFALAAISAPLLFPMKVSWGIEVDLASLIPKWPGLISYLTFFLVGWLMFRNIDKLPAMLRNWRWQLAAGVALTVPYYFYNHFAAENGYVTYQYPKLVVEDITFDPKTRARDYPAFRDQLLHTDGNPIANALWQALPAANQEFIHEHKTATENQLSGLLSTLNRTVLALPEFTQSLDTSSLQLSDSAQAALSKVAEERSVEENTLVNRQILEAGFAGIVLTEDIHRPYYYPMRAGYSYYYSLMTWLLIFGCIGFSQNYFHAESRFWRYFSDSSYWFYLAHLPIQFQILLWLGAEPWHWTLKFLVYVVGTIAVLLPSYHFLVRPTWIGWLLNGRMFSIRKKRSSELPSAYRPVKSEAA